MTHVIAQPCVNVKDKACVDVCPVDCIHGGETDPQLYINPNASFQFPDDRFWSCEKYAAHPNITDPILYTAVDSTTGSGLPAGVTGQYCQYSYLHADDTLQSCGNTFKIIRTWTIINWCTGQIVLTDSDGDDNEQIIKLVDDQKPTMTIPPAVLSALFAPRPACCRHPPFTTSATT